MRICKHCGAEYRGLACPCRKRAWQEARARETKRTDIVGESGAVSESGGGIGAPGAGGPRPGDGDNAQPLEGVVSGER